MYICIYTRRVIFWIKIIELKGIILDHISRLTEGMREPLVKVPFSQVNLYSILCNQVIKITLFLIRNQRGYMTHQVSVIMVIDQSVVHDRRRGLASKLT